MADTEGFAVNVRDRIGGLRNFLAQNWVFIAIFVAIVAAVYFLWKR